MDFAKARVLQLSGQTNILLDQDDRGGETGGTHRYWEFTVHAWYEDTLAYAIEWTFLDYSPYLPDPDGA